MAVILAASTFLKDPTRQIDAGPGETISLTPDEEAALIRSGSAVAVESAAPPTLKKGDRRHG
jgi:hypothetical protein